MRFRPRAPYSYIVSIQVALAGINAGSAVAQRALCDLSPLTARPIPAPIKFGSQRLDTDTRISFVFLPTGPGIFKIVRTDQTFLFSLAEKLSAEISAKDRTLPKNDCAQYARTYLRYAGVTSPTFTIEAAVEASTWSCPSTKLPCAPKLPKFNELPSKATPINFSPSTSFEYKEPGSETQTGTIMAKNFFEEVAPYVVPFQSPPQIPGPLQTPGVRMCNVRLAKTILGKGSGFVRYKIFGEILANKVKLSSEKYVDFHLNDQTKFVATLLGGEIGFVSTFAIEKFIEQIISSKLDAIPRRIPMPQDPNRTIDLDWATRSAKFESTFYAGKTVPTFVVVRDYESSEAVACAARNLFSKF
jgi:hypothetical protein